MFIYKVELDEKAKNGKCIKEDNCMIITYRFALRLIPDEVYWNEMNV